MANELVHAFIDTHLNEHIRKVQELIQQPSVSLDGNGLRECADLVRQRLIELGC